MKEPQLHTDDDKNSFILETGMCPRFC